MKKILFLLVFVSSLSIAQSQKTIEDHAIKNWFILNKAAVRFENIFVLEDSIKTHLSNKEYYFTVFGEKINLKIAKTRKTYAGHIYMDNHNGIRDFNEIKNLEIQILKNNKILKNWTSVIQAKSYDDSYVYDGKTYIENGYSPYTDSLVDGDKLVILFRKKGQESFLKWHFEKIESARKPFVIASISNDLKKTISFENFIQESIDKLHKYKTLDKTNFYDGFPEDYGSKIIGNSSIHFKNEKYCLVFRKPNGKKRTYDSFEYRISINSKTGEWTNSNGIIFLDFKESGTEYKLEVRYKDDPKHVAFYKCYTEPDWYQTLWFKIIIGMLSLLLLSIIYIFWLKKVNERKRLEQKSKIKMLYAQLNPHFVFNALGSIQGLLNDNQIEKANQYLVGFGSLLRNTLSSGEKETQSLEIEIKSISNYIELEQLRNPFLFCLNIDEKVNVRETQTIPLLIQPLIENAIKHGISNKEKGEISLTISKKANDLIFELSDNGKGFDILAEQKGFGLKLVKDRITLFNQSSKKMKIDMTIESDLSGTQITILFKNWLKND